LLCRLAVVLITLANEDCNSHQSNVLVLLPRLTLPWHARLALLQLDYDNPTAIETLAGAEITVSSTRYRTSNSIT
jgi:hypothetical protein